MRTLIFCTFIFSILDGLCILLIEISGWARIQNNPETLHFQEPWWKIESWALHLWNEAHRPIRYFIDPIFFPVVTTHPPSISILQLHIYEATCVLQSTLIGFFLGLLVQTVKKFISKN